MGRGRKHRAREASLSVDEIVAYADSHDVDLIVVGSRGHGAIAGALLGSVSLGLLGESKRPILIVKAATVAAPVGAEIEAWASSIAQELRP